MQTMRFEQDKIIIQLLFKKQNHA